MNVLLLVVANIVFVSLLVLAITPRIARPLHASDELWLHPELGANGEAVTVRDQHGRYVKGTTAVSYHAEIESIDTITITCLVRDAGGYWIAGRHP